MEAIVQDTRALLANVRRVMKHLEPSDYNDKLRTTLLGIQNVAKKLDTGLPGEIDAIDRAVSEREEPISDDSDPSGSETSSLGEDYVSGLK
jgi:hypothetical protein